MLRNLVDLDPVYQGNSILVHNHIIFSHNEILVSNTLTRISLQTGLFSLIIVWAAVVC